MSEERDNEPPMGAFFPASVRGLRERYRAIMIVDADLPTSTLRWRIVVCLTPSVRCENSKQNSRNEQRFDVESREEKRCKPTFGAHDVKTLVRAERKF
jgi:hypothetical protein